MSFKFDLNSLSNAELVKLKGQINSVLKKRSTAIKRRTDKKHVESKMIYNGTLKNTLKVYWNSSGESYTIDEDGLKELFPKKSMSENVQTISEKLDSALYSPYENDTGCEGDSKSHPQISREQLDKELDEMIAERDEHFLMTGQFNKLTF